MANPAEYLIGPFLIGTSVELVLQGVVSTQFVKYFGTYRDDPLTLKAYVAGLALMTYALSIYMFVIVWYLFAVRFGTVLLGVPHTNETVMTGCSGIMRAVIGLYVQAYFCSRLFLLSRKWYNVAALASIFVGSFVANLVGTLYVVFGGIEAFPIVERCFDIALPLNMVGDIALTSSTAYFLIKYKKNVLPQSVGVLNALVRLTFQTAAPATICAFVNFVVSLTFPNVYPSARIFAATTFNIVLPKLAAFSMMWTLNARQHIRSTLHLHVSDNARQHIRSTLHSHVSDTGVHSHVSDIGERTVTGDAERGSAEGKLKISIETSKSHFGYGAERRADGVTDGRASLGMQDSERSEDLIFARRGNAQGAQDFEGSAEDLVFARPGNARG
ncbi:hypothetical protein B0H13DRAFT_2666030 [Mycena leptocephala]|nr:hypothetical protein B0H13DRAFT_2666030 [Mycena leptocephala]